MNMMDDSGQFSEKRLVPDIPYIFFREFESTVA
jgi:hypothetical protein